MVMGLALWKLLFGSKESISRLSFDLRKIFSRLAFVSESRTVWGYRLKTATSYNKQNRPCSPVTSAFFFFFSRTQGKVANNQLHSFGFVLG